MPNDLSPICKALIALFASEAVIRSIDDIEAALPDADRKAVRDELQMLVRAEVVRQAIRWSDGRLVYWLASAPIASFTGTLFHYPPQELTFADVGGVAPAQEIIHG
jgi:hypothetical protein